MMYKESLPSSCPPSEAILANECKVLRFIPAQTATQADFHSQAKINNKGKPKNVSECCWAACSVFDSVKGRNQVANLMKLPKFKNKYHYIAELFLDNNSGKVMPAPSGTGHISLWMFDSFDPVAAIVGTESIKKWA